MHAGFECAKGIKATSPKKVAAKEIKVLKVITATFMLMKSEARVSHEEVTQAFVYSIQLDIAF